MLRDAISRLATRCLPPSVTEKLAYWRRRMLWLVRYLKGPRSSFLHFQCNVCGRHVSFPHGEFSREYWSCFYCGSNVRWRSVIHALSMELFGISLTINEFPLRPDLAGAGMSDWHGYASRLSEKFSYVNTYYHQEPLLDITSIDASQNGRYDFIISSDVFEHIQPPIALAFENARRLLKPGGVMIFTVPYVEGGTKEHFPELHRFAIEKNKNTLVLRNQTREGKSQEYSDLVFHGGPGSVLEMRLFGKDDLLRNFKAAGFGTTKLYDEEHMEHGVMWILYVAEKAPYRPLIHGLDTAPWALRNDRAPVDNTTDNVASKEPDSLAAMRERGLPHE